MKDERKGFIPFVVKGVLRILSWIYAAAIRFVDLGYRAGIRHEHKLSVPVVSIGNMTLGGTGKTPLTVFLADYLRASGKNPGVLTRGYGNDENRMLAEELFDIPIFTGQDRVKNARIAISQGCDILVLDDGFQHRRLARDLNILLLDSVNIFSAGHNIFPRGILREPDPAIRRADIIMLTKIDRIDTGRREEITSKLQKYARGKPVVTARLSPSLFTDTTGAEYSSGSLRTKQVMIVSGIADPAHFVFSVEKLGAMVVAREDYPDHYRYTQADISHIVKKSEEASAEKIIVTSKDYVKMRGLDLSNITEKLFILNVVMDIIDGKEHLLAGLDSVSRGQSA